MPLYEYKCLKCGRHTEKIEHVSGPHLKKCPHCGGKVESVISAPAIQFKGSGWYVTDYAGKSTDGGSQAAAGDAKDSAKDTGAKDGPKNSAAKDSSSGASSSKESSTKDKSTSKKK